jgi:hypothetical protein
VGRIANAPHSVKERLLCFQRHQVDFVAGLLDEPPFVYVLRQVLVPTEKTGGIATLRATNRTFCAL